MNYRYIEILLEILIQYQGGLLLPALSCIERPTAEMSRTYEVFCGRCQKGRKVSADEATSDGHVPSVFKARVVRVR